MISRIRGTLETVAENRIELRCADLVYEIMIPSYLENFLRAQKGEVMELRVRYYIEGGPGMAAMVPRLIGFESEADREFYNQLIKVPGLGAKTALKCMVVAPAEIARAIETGNKAALGNLPGVGARTADKIIAALKGKVTAFAQTATGEAAAAAPVLSDMEEDAVMVLLKLSYKRVEAEQMVKKARKRDPALASAEAIVQAVFKEIGRGAVR